MAHTTSALQSKLSSEAENNEGLPWSSLEAAVELLLGRLDSISTAVGGSSASDEYASVVDLATTNGTIPVGALSWSITAVSGTVTVSTKALAVGSTVGGGGYSGKTLKTAISYTISAGSALVVYDTLG